MGRSRASFQVSVVNLRVIPSAKTPGRLHRSVKSGNITGTTFYHTTNVAWQSTDIVNEALTRLIPVPSRRKQLVASCQQTVHCSSGQA